MLSKKFIASILLVLVLLVVYYFSFVSVNLYDKKWRDIKDEDLALYCASGGKMNKHEATLLNMDSNFVSKDTKYYYCSSSEKYTLDSFCQDGNFQIVNYLSLVGEGKVFAGDNGQSCYEQARK